jgi:hypothetical protein
VQEGKGLVGHHSLDVEEMSGNFALREQILFLFHISSLFDVYKKCIKNEGLL